jgi:hypothetical protein
MVIELLTTTPLTTENHMARYLSPQEAKQIQIARLKQLKAEQEEAERKRRSEHRQATLRRNQETLRAMGIR